MRFIICVPEIGFFKVLLYLNPDFSFEVADAKKMGAKSYIRPVKHTIRCNSWKNRGAVF